MPDLSSSWPLAEKPEENDIVVISSGGIRLWSAPCSVNSFNGSLRLACSDKATLENLHRQPRVAFTLIKSGISGTMRGSAIAQIVEEDAGQGLISLQPYRVLDDRGGFELRISGWKAVQDEAPLKSGFSFWYQAFRAVTLPLSILPVLIGAGAGFVSGFFSWPILVLALLGTILMHAGANAVADYFDFKRGVDRSTALSSHLGALARERVEPESILLAAFACFAVSILIGLLLVQMVGWLLLLFGLVGLLGSFFYTGRPLSYKYRGLGELMLGFLLGPVILMGSFYVQTLSWSWPVFLLSVSLGMLVSSVTLANNLRDLPDDRAAGIRTLPMAIGIPAAKRLYYGLVMLPFLVAAGAVLLDFRLWPIVVVLLALPKAIGTVRPMRLTENSEESIRHKALGSPFPLNSIKLHLRFGLLLLAGVLIAGVIQIV
jgi:1,4-dihydroxy-2-naphthoate octaprenyltransferase